jgi:hypothetical protein
MSFTDLIPFTPNVKDVTYSIVLNPDGRQAPLPPSVVEITNVVPILSVDG